MVEWLEETFRWTDEQRLEKQRRRAGRKVAKFLAKKHKLEKKRQGLGLSFTVSTHSPPTLTCQDWLS